MEIFLRIFIGFFTGMLINYLADVLPISRRFTRPICHACEKSFSIRDYLFSLRCQNCGRLRSVRFFLVLIFSVITVILLGYFPFAGLNDWASFPILAYLGTIVVIDIEHHSVLHETTLFGLLMMFVYGLFLHGLRSTLYGALGGFLITLGLYLLGIIFTRIVGWLRRKNLSAVAFGFGDVSAATVLGLLSGWPGIFGVILAAILAFGLFSLVYLIFMLATKRYHSFGNALPFAPFLVLGVVVIFYL